MTTATTGWRSSRALRVFLIVVGSLVALLILMRLVLDPLAARFARSELEKLEGFTATFTDVHIGILPPTFTLTNFKLIEEPAGRWDEPLIYVERAETGVHWRKLLEGQLVAHGKLIGPKFVAARKHEQKAEKAPEAGEQLTEMMPLRVDKFEVIDGEVLIAQGKGKAAPKLWLHKVNLTATNLATRKALMEDEPASLRLRGKVQRTGDLKVDASIDPWTELPTFTSKAALENLQARDLYAFLAEKTDLKAVEGEINLFVEAKARDGVLKGGVKPVFEKVEIESNSESLGSKIKALLADTAVDVLSDDNDGRDAIATVIPLRGNIKEPQTQLVPTVLGVVRNAFVTGLRSGFADLPPKTAPQEEGVIKQAWKAIKEDEGPPDAQPVDEQDKEPAKKPASRSGHKSSKASHR